MDESPEPKSPLDNVLALNARTGNYEGINRTSTMIYSRTRSMVLRFELVI
jgi:hypothetical protein